MPLTTNFLIAGTNNLIDAYETNLAGGAEPGVDPESEPTNPAYDANYNTTGVRRLKFGGDTAADDGIRLGLEQLMANTGFNDPDVVKYMVIFTDGAWNASRTLFAAPGYTNEVSVPGFTASELLTNLFLSNAAGGQMANGTEFYTNGGVIFYGPWDSTVTNNMTPNNNLYLMPSLSPLADATNALAASSTNDYANLATEHNNDVWLSADTSGYEPLGSPSASGSDGAPQFVTNTTLLYKSGGNSYYTHYLDVWLQPGSVAFYYTNAAAVTNSSYTAYVSDYTKPTKHIRLYVNLGGKVDLVVPGYVADGVAFDKLDLTYPDNPAYGITGYPRYRYDNFQVPYMWPDDVGGNNHNDPNNAYLSASLERDLMFRNYANLLTGFYVFRGDEPNGPGTEPLITDATNGAPRPRYGLGAYYPSAGFYWPFGGEYTNSADTYNASGYVTNAVGIDTDPTYGLQLPTSGADAQSRHVAYSINMLSTNAAPEWYGELFYDSISGGGTTVTSGTGNTAASQIMHSADWQNGAPNFLAPFISTSGIMISEATHNTNIAGSPSVWRPESFNGSNFYLPGGIGSVTRGNSQTGGYVTDGKGKYYSNTMAWSGRPTHYFDFTQSKWVSIPNNHVINNLFLPIGNWKAEEYAWHARALGVTIYTVGYGSYVTPAECAMLAQIANATNTISASGESNISFNASQPIGQQFYATNSAQISNDFYSVGQAINEALTGGN